MYSTADAESCDIMAELIRCCFYENSYLHLNFDLFSSMI